MSYNIQFCVNLRRRRCSIENRIIATRQQQNKQQQSETRNHMPMKLVERLFQQMANVTIAKNTTAA